MIKKTILCFVILIGGILAGCAGYKSIPSGEAKIGNDSIIIDVRGQEDYDTSHIPGAICIPNESIDKSIFEKLPDKNKEIFVYCQSGVRSKQAAEKLTNLGYVNVTEIGGINDWHGEVVSNPFLGRYYSGLYYIDLKENTYSFGSDDEELEEGTWKVNNNNLTLTSKNNTYSFHILKRVLETSDDYYGLQKGSRFTLEPQLIGDTVYMMTGTTYRFDGDIKDIHLITSTKKENVHEQGDEQSDGAYRLTLLRDNGTITSFRIEDNAITVITSDGRDEAEVEVEYQNGEKKIFTIIYDCNCGK